MSTRAMGPGAGLSWLARAINLGSRNAAAIFGGAVLLLGTIFAVALLASIAGGLLHVAMGGGEAVANATGLLLGLVLMVMMASLMVGYLRLIHAVESGRPARATDIFSGYRDLPATLRAIALVIVIALAQNALIFGLVSALAPDVVEWYRGIIALSMQGEAMQPPTSVPQGFGTAFAVICVVALFGYGVQALALGQVALAGRSALGALGDGVAGAARNLLPLLVLLLVAFAVTFAVAIVAMLLTLLVSVLAKVAGAWLGIVIGIPLYLACMLVMYVVVFGVMYHLWRDICGIAADAGGQPSGQPEDRVEL